MIPLKKVICCVSPQHQFHLYSFDTSRSTSVMYYFCLWFIDIETNFFPWLMAEVNNSLEKRYTARALVDSKGCMIFYQLFKRDDRLILNLPLLMKGNQRHFFLQRAGGSLTCSLWVPSRGSFKTLHVCLMWNLMHRMWTERSLSSLSAIIHDVAQKRLERFKELETQMDQSDK